MTPHSQAYGIFNADGRCSSSYIDIAEESQETLLVPGREPVGSFMLVDTSNQGRGICLIIAWGCSFFQLGRQILEAYYLHLKHGSIPIITRQSENGGKVWNWKEEETPRCKALEHLCVLSELLAKISASITRHLFFILHIIVFCKLLVSFFSLTSGKSEHFALKKLMHWSLERYLHVANQYKTRGNYQDYNNNNPLRGEEDHQGAQKATSSQY